MPTEIPDTAWQYWGPILLMQDGGEFIHDDIPDVPSVELRYPAVRSCAPPANSPSSYRRIASGDRIVVESQSVADFEDETWEMSYSLDCHVQQRMAAPDVSFRSRGQNRRFQIFFSCDPEITTDNRILWTHQGCTEFANPKIFQVLDHYSRARPGQSAFLWVVECELLSTRREKVSV